MNIRESFTKREWLGIGIIPLLCFSSFMSWTSFQSVMSDSALIVWHSVLWFSLLLSSFFLGAVVWQKKTLRVLGILGVLFPGAFLFLSSWEYIGASLLALFLFYFGTSAVAKEGEDHLHFHFFKNVRGGSFFFVFGLSLLVATGYYLSLKNVTWEEMVPRFRIGDGMTKVIFKTAGIINPSFAELSKEDTTVDDFLRTLNTHTETVPDEKLQNIPEQDTAHLLSEMNQFLKQKNITLLLDANQTKTAETLFLEGGREQIASLAGRPVKGDEKISDILSSAVQNKLITFMNGGKTLRHIPSSAIPFFLSLLLFLTLFSLSSILVPLCILFSWFLFFLCCKFGWLTIATVPVEQEYLMK